MADIWWYKQRRQWAADVTLPHGKGRVRWYLGPDEQVARRDFHLRMAQLYGDSALREAGAPRLVDLADAWITWNETNRAYKTAQSRRVYLRWIVHPYGNVPALDITPDLIEQIKAAKLQTNAPRSVNHFVRAVTGLYRWARTHGLIGENPLEHVARVREKPPRRLALEWDDAVRACEIADRRPPLGDYMRVLLHTGMRRSELAGLAWDAYDRRQRMIRLDEHKTDYTGRARFVPVNAEAHAAIIRQPRTGEAIFAFDDDGRPRTGPYFTTRYKRLCLSPELSAADRRLLKAAHFHALRHTLISHLRRRGVPAYIVGEIVGHTSTLTTRYYTRAFEADLRDAVEGIDKPRAE